MTSKNCRHSDEFEIVKLASPSPLTFVNQPKSLDLHAMDIDLLNTNQWKPEFVEKEDCEVRQPLNLQLDVQLIKTQSNSQNQAQHTPRGGVFKGHTPRGGVFGEDEVAKPRSRGEEVRDSFRISLGPEVFRRARADKLRRQVRVFSALLAILVVFLFLGVFYFNPFKLHRMKESTEWEMSVSQLGLVFGVMFVAILVNIGFLLRSYCAHRRIKKKWDSMENNFY